MAGVQMATPREVEVEVEVDPGAGSQLEGETEGEGSIRNTIALVADVCVSVLDALCVCVYELPCPMTVPVR
jgi:hypothetical protein